MLFISGMPPRADECRHGGNASPRACCRLSARHVTPARLSCATTHEPEKHENIYAVDDILHYSLCFWHYVDISLMRIRGVITDEPRHQRIRTAGVSRRRRGACLQCR